MINCGFDSHLQSRTRFPCNARKIPLLEVSRIQRPTVLPETKMMTNGTRLPFVRCDWPIKVLNCINRRSSLSFASIGLCRQQFRSHGSRRSERYASSTKLFRLDSDAERNRIVHMHPIAASREPVVSFKLQWRPFACENAGSFDNFPT